MARKEHPEIINLPESTVEAIKLRLREGGALLEEDKKIVLSILSAYMWLSRQLQTTKLNMQRLRSLFGFSTEKRSKLKAKDNNSTEASGIDGAGSTLPLGEQDNPEDPKSKK
jgi:hypothetical protein